jgi:pimeloyl-ACP methyl ester carboxylesterase
MATPTPKPASRRPTQTTPKRVVEIVDPRWLLKAILLTIVAAAVCAYLALCLLVYQGGWQLLLHPSSKIDAAPSTPFQAVRFDSAATGTPRLTGWWIPADSGPLATPARTILYLHDGSGSLSSSVRELALLHSANVNIFAIDYRGFGQSEGPHPTETRMLEDANAALDYLLNTRHLPAAQILPYGVGLGAVLAARLADSHPNLPAVIIDSPDPEAYERATTGGKSRLLPMKFLVEEHFDLASALGAFTRPKLLLANSPYASDSERIDANQALFRSLPDPKMSATFGNPVAPGNGDYHVDAEHGYLRILNRFLDENVPQ